MSFAGNNYTGNYLTISGDVLVPNPGTGNWTIQTWFKASDTTGWQGIWFLNNQYALQVNTSTGIEFYYGSSQRVIVSSFSTGVWYCMTVTKTGTTSARAFLNGTQVGAEITTGLSSQNTGSPGFGAWDPVNAPSDYVRGSIGPTKIWSAQLAPNEVMREAISLAPVRSQDLLAFYPFLSGGSSERIKNYQGTNGNLTQTGTSFTDDVSPPVPWKASSYLVPFAASGLVLDAYQSGNNIELAWI